MRPYLFGTLALVLTLVFVAAGYTDQTRLHWVAEESNPTPQPMPDLVVGIEWRCTLVTSGSREDYRGTGICFASQRGEDVHALGTDGKTNLFNRRQELTIRTPMGTSYTVIVSPSIYIALGDEWPPK